MHLRNLTAQRKAKSCSALRAGSCLIFPVKRFCDPFDMLPGNADSMIPDGDQISAAAFSFNYNRIISFGIHGCFERIIRQIGDQEQKKILAAKDCFIFKPDRIWHVVFSDSASNGISSSAAISDAATVDNSGFSFCVIKIFSICVDR